MEAVQDPEVRIQLSYHTMIGTRKQSVSDVEQIFSLGVLNFMERTNYEFEAHYVKIIRNWRRSCDERGLSDDERSRFNEDFIEYILDDGTSNQITAPSKSTSKQCFISIPTRTPTVTLNYITDYTTAGILPTSEASPGRHCLLYLSI